MDISSGRYWDVLTVIEASEKKMLGVKQIAKEIYDRQDDLTDSEINSVRVIINRLIDHGSLDRDKKGRKWLYFLSDLGKSEYESIRKEKRKKQERISRQAEMLKSKMAGESEIESSLEQYINENHADGIAQAILNYPGNPCVLEIDHKKLAGEYPFLIDMLESDPGEFERRLKEKVCSVFNVGSGSDREDFLPEIKLVNVPANEKLAAMKRKNAISNSVHGFEGMITNISETSSYIREAVYDCPDCGSYIPVDQKDPFSPLQSPMQCPYCSRLGSFSNIVAKKYSDYQIITVHEPIGTSNPVSIMVLLEDSFCDHDDPHRRRLLPGKNVKIIGYPVARPLYKYKRQYSRIKTYFRGLNITPEHDESERENFDEVEIEQFEEFSKRSDLFDVLISCIAPHVHGMEEIKESLVLQMFGGATVDVENTVHIRGDIHILLIGDPGSAKSMLLDFMKKNTPKAMFVTGKGSSAAGLTATVVKNEDIGGYMLQPGVMVLANNGLAVIDEFDKMDKEGQKALHTAMEQQFVSINKANIHAILPARTAVLAAMNPKYGRFDNYADVSDQINLVDAALLDRFDLKFIIKDIPEDEKDRNIIRKMMETRKNMNVSYPADMNFIKRYVLYAKRNFHPKMNDETEKWVEDYYLEMRGKSAGSQLMISSREAATIMRLSEASARARLSNEVHVQDVRRAVRILNYALSQFGYDLSAYRTGQKEEHLKLDYRIKDTLTELHARYGKVTREELIDAVTTSDCARETVESRIKDMVYNEKLVEKGKYIEFAGKARKGESS